MSNRQEFHRTAHPAATSGFVGSNKSCLIAGVGNHDLMKTRHSIGMVFVDYVANRLNMRWSKDRNSFSVIARGCIGEEDLELILLKSKHPMNLNGKSIAKAASSMNVPIDHIYLVQDELDKAVGKFTIKEGGSTRGHRGIQSAVQCLKTENLPRLRLGIDRPSSPNDVGDYVLERFSAEDNKLIHEKFPSALQMLLRHIQKRLDINEDLVKSLKLAR